MGLKSYTPENELKAIQYSYNSLHGFLLNFWEEIESDPFVDGPHIKFVCDVLQDYAHAIINRYYIEDLVINVPPGTSKTTITSIMFPSWLWLHAPWLVAISSSYSYDLTVRPIAKTRQIIKSEKFHRWFDPIHLEHFGKTLQLTSESAKLLENNFNGARIGTSTGGTITGKHGHVILGDDPLKPTEAISDTLRPKANRYWDETLSSRKKDKRITPRILTMQRLHESDTSGHVLAKDPTIRHVCLPAEYSEDVKPEAAKALYKNGLLDPVRMPQDVLDKEKVTLGSYGYAGQFMQRPAPIGGGIIKPSWFPEYNLSMMPGVIKAPTHYFVDTAYTEKSKNDPTGILAGSPYRNDLYLKGYKSVRMEFPELVEFIPKFVEHTGGDHRSGVMIEPKASGLSVIQYLRRFTRLNVIEAPAPKEDKITRATVQTLIFEGGRVKVPAGQPWVKPFLEQLGIFPSGAHDEEVDCLVGLTDKILVKSSGPRGLRSSV